MHCSKCGKQVSDEATFCRYCGNRLDKGNKGVNSQGKVIEQFQNGNINKYKKYSIIGIIIIVLVLYVFVFRCKSGFCPLPSVFRGDYCIIHTCNRNRCYNKVVKGKDYCYTHMPSTTTDYNYTPEKAEDVIDFSDISINSNSSYTICTATVTNNGKRTYTFVEVKGKFKDSSGTVLDTDWTYAVGSEKLAPGESVSIRLSVKKDSNITQCDLEIIDYDRE